MLQAIPLAKCAVCVANEREYGWFILGGTAIVLALGMALFFAWQDHRRRSGQPLGLVPDEPDLPHGS